MVLKQKMLDETSQYIYDALVLSGADNKESASILFTCMRNILLSENNIKSLASMGIDKENLDIKTTLAIQEIWVNDYAKVISDEHNDTNLT